MQGRRESFSEQLVLESSRMYLAGKHFMLPQILLSCFFVMFVNFGAPN